MKPTYVQAGLMLLFLIFLNACSSDKKKSKDDIGEPNNSILEAGLLESGKTYTMKIDSVGDVDWYGLAVPEQGYVSVQAKQVPDNINLNVRFAHKQAWKTEKQQWITGWSKVPKTIPVRKPDTLYFAVIDDYNNESSTEDIVFKAAFIPEMDTLEPNDDPKNAVAVSSGQIMETYFFPKSDIDWFKINVDDPGYLMIQAKSVPENITINARYAKKKDQYSKVENISGWHKLPAGIQVTDPGVYYFSLIDDYNNQMSKDKAVWKIDNLPEMDTTEPNNTFKEAYPLKIGDTVASAIFPKKDNDIFKFASDSITAVHVVALEHPDNIKPEVRLYVKEDLKEKSLGGWHKLPHKFDLETERQYYVKLHDDYDNEFSTEPVVIQLIPAEQSEEEQND